MLVIYLGRQLSPLFHTGRVETETLPKLPLLERRLSVLSFCSFIVLPVVVYISYLSFIHRICHLLTCINPKQLLCLTSGQFPHVA